MSCATRLPKPPDLAPSPWPCVRIAQLSMTAPGGAWLLLELEAGISLPAGPQAGGDWLLVLSGRLLLDGRVLKAQDCANIPPGMAHPAEALEASLCLIGQRPAGPAQSD
jgi:hypothetical protein